MSEDLQRAIKNAKRALLSYRHAIELLEAEMPEEVLKSIHYNGSRAAVPEEYREAANIICKYQQARSAATGLSNG